MLVGFAVIVFVVWLAGRSGGGSAGRTPVEAGSVSLAALDASTEKTEETKANKPTKVRERAPGGGTRFRRLLDDEGRDTGERFGTLEYYSYEVEFPVLELPDQSSLSPHDRPSGEEVANAPVAKSVPESPELLISPYEDVLIDATGLAAGTVFKDPDSPPDAPRFIKVPDGK